jgi:chromosome partitioning protein
MTMKEKRYNLTSQVSNEIIKFFNKKVYLTTIPRNVRLAEAPSHGLPVALYDANSKGAEAYLSLAEEIMKRNGTMFTKISRVKKIKFKGDNDEQ